MATALVAAGGWIAANAGTALSIAATIGGGVMSYAQSQAQARSQQNAANLYLQQSQAQQQMAQVRAKSLLAQEQSEEIALTQERISLRKAAWAEQQAAMAQAAGRGVVAAPWGSLGALAEESSNNLYRDLEANRGEQVYKATAYALELAGVWAGTVAGMTNSIMQSNIASTNARNARLEGLQGMVGAGYKAYTIWDTKNG